jgi:hypothetical protein
MSARNDLTVNYLAGQLFSADMYAKGELTFLSTVGLRSINPFGNCVSVRQWLSRLQPGLILLPYVGET